MTDSQPPEWSRNHGVRAGEDFVDGLWIRGYEDRSVWGFDVGVGTFFAQLWSNSSRDDSPDLWLTAPMALSHAETVVAPLVEATGRDPLVVVRAMGIARPNPIVASATRVLEYMDQLDQRPPSGLTDGERTACRWMVGETATSPSSQSAPDSSDHLTPSAAVVDAEAAHATGVSYTLRTDHAVGVETALIFALAQRM